MKYDEAIATQDAIDRSKEIGLALDKLRTAANIGSMSLMDLTQALPAFLPSEDNGDAVNG